eukprot:5167198-Lingulodinium_polyedra.AAC.1
MFAREHGVGFVIENPAPSPGRASLFLMPSMARLAQLPGVEHTDLHQCRYGARATKPTRLLSW